MGLLTRSLRVQPSKDCVQKTLKRLEEKIAGKVLNQILYSMNCSDPVMQHRTATALARLARENDLKTVFVDRKGLDILLNILTDPTRDAICHKEAAGPSDKCHHHALQRGLSQSHHEVCSVAASLSMPDLCTSPCSSGQSLLAIERCSLWCRGNAYTGLVDDVLRGSSAHAGALFELAKKANATAPIDCAPAPPTPQVRKPFPHSNASGQCRRQRALHASSPSSSKSSLGGTCQPLPQLPCSSAAACLLQANSEQHSHSPRSG